MDISKINDWYELEDIKNNCIKRQNQIMEEDWEKAYKQRTPNHYISLSDVFWDFDIYNLEIQIPERSNKIKELKDYTYNKNNRVSKIISKAKELGLTLPPRFTTMICDLCVCRGCPYTEDCNGITCDSCKPTYKHYNWECNE